MGSETHVRALPYLHEDVSRVPRAMVEGAYRGALPRRQGADQIDEAVHPFDGLSIDGENHIVHLEPRLGEGPFRIQPM